MKVRLVDGHYYQHATEGDIGDVVGMTPGNPNLLVDWGHGAVKAHVTRLEEVDEVP